MKVPQSTVRLSVVVGKCGQPEALTLWEDPRKDPRFQAALKRNRVMTVKQETVGSKKDFGVVGFYREKNVSLWVFPKPLDAFKDKRIIGIDYDLLKVSKPVGKVEHVEPPKKERPRPQPVEEPQPAEEPKPEWQRFRVTIRATATVEVTQDVEAETAKEAREQALRSSTAQPLDFSSGEISRKVTSLKRLDRD